MTQEEEDSYSLEEKFDAAVKVIWTLPHDGPFQPSDDMMLMFYSYYKQATLGPCNMPRPSSFWDTRGKAKWDAWNALGDMTREEAMKNYVEDIQLILETIPISSEVTDLVQKLGNFYTEIENNDEETIENEVDKKPFTRPFAKHTDKLIPSIPGYGDLWDDIQNPHETGYYDSVVDVSVDSKEIKSHRKNGTDDISEGESMEDEEMEEKGWTPDSMLLMVEDKRWRSNCSSMELSVSSITNGTHSSLNSEVEEEELACSVEPSSTINQYISFNGYPSGNCAAVKHFRSADSDNEEFCDSIEHLAIEECLSTSKAQSHESRPTSMRQSNLWFESHSTLNSANDSRCDDKKRGMATPRCGLDSQLGVDVNATCCVSHSTQSVCNSRGHIDEQIATALLKLQHDMDTVLYRLQTLEVLSASQPQSPSPEQHPLPAALKFTRPSWWPFQFSPVRVVFVIWPVFAHWLVHFFLRIKRRKIS